MGEASACVDVDAEVSEGYGEGNGSLPREIGVKEEGDGIVDEASNSTCLA